MNLQSLGLKMLDQRNQIIDWLLEEGWTISDKSELTLKLAHAFQDAGVRVSRIRLSIRLLHPQVMGFSYTWDERAQRVDYFEAGHEMRETELYRNSPFAAIFDDEAGAIRRNLIGDNCLLDYPILQDLKDEGFTDYVALPLIFSDGRRSAITLASCAKDGFSSHDLSLIYDSLSALARIIENHALKHTASVLLETYLGRETGNQVLSGKVQRGDGQRIRSVIWFSDLRQSTNLAESMKSDDFLELLNQYFECTAGAVLEHGGEVLRYIGDAVLAIFPLGPTDDCIDSNKAAINAEKAARLAFQRLELLNEKQRDKGEPEIASGIGLHVGEVMYGNIGTQNRLEFSVIGSSANEAARLESMTKELNTPVVVSDQFTQLHGGNWRTLGSYDLKGFTTKRELFTFSTS
ncbi:adenylate/guanylate cyclase domain-containing protein [Terasakiella sp. A23]|uniref:adenylate/guanylate cyclase domain-containing protein n=1 Tax=Terasakiella sp. FCG-A23 TaxID=3080561 RepID=UPI00295371BF|nr:adenylate/guanylate cyclase domain-containing protein [Terasakiella sp. A23]MDV7340315.1 adenylate/guanylate cyclase domain-containing protein [Terasakiella sp. A23]